jgi:hypothetical protein
MCCFLVQASHDGVHILLPGEQRLDRGRLVVVSAGKDIDKSNCFG